MVDYKNVLVEFISAVFQGDHVIAHYAVAECKHSLPSEEWQELQQLLDDVEKEYD